MRRKDKEITDIDAKIAIIEKCKYCRLGIALDNSPYVIPLNYGYTFENEKLSLFFHSANEGKKIDVLRNNNSACFEVDCDAQLVKGIKACNYGYAFKSIIGYGKITFLESNKEKADGLNQLMKHQTGETKEYTYSDNMLNKVCVLKMDVDEFKGKQCYV